MKFMVDDRRQHLNDARRVAFGLGVDWMPGSSPELEHQQRSLRLRVLPVLWDHGCTRFAMHCQQLFAYC
jgi:hypothetical protein